MWGKGGWSNTAQRERTDLAAAFLQETPVTPRANRTHAVSGDPYAFLRGSLLTPAQYDRAKVLAENWGESLPRAAISLGWLCPEQYGRKLAEHLGLSWITEDQVSALCHPKETPGLSPPFLCLRLATGTLAYAIDGLDLSPVTLGRFVAAMGETATRRLVVFSSLTKRRLFERYLGREILAWAVYGLERHYPDLSARGKLTASQTAYLTAAMGGVLGAAAMAPLPTLSLLGILLNMGFLPVIALRCAAFVHLLRLPAAQKCLPLHEDRFLPVYTILVPLFREAHMLPNIVTALMALDYPKAKLDIKLLLEQEDVPTQRAVAAMDLPGCFEVLSLPPGLPQTKPRALNYGLQFARGTFVTVYDAEDLPEPGQLRAALAAFHWGPKTLACVQARLNYYNSRENWLAQAFTVEYSTQFDAVLPALRFHGLPLLLGGTSNHFRTDILRKVGAWDAFNVTEDADLGIRLARFGYVCGVLPATTYEEACCHLGGWVRQRTRWMKGWLQTYFVHMRAPRKLRKDLGARGFWAFQGLLGAHVLSALVHPVFTALIFYQWLFGGGFPWPETPLDFIFWALALSNFVLGYAVSLALGWVTLQRRGLRGLTWGLIGLPLYWLLLSFATYRALFHFLRDPFHWEKTEHRGQFPHGRREPGGKENPRRKAAASTGRFPAR